MRRRHFRTCAKWACTFVALLAAGTAVASRFFALMYVRSANHGEGALFVELGGGLLSVQHFDRWTFQSPREELGWTAVAVDYWHWGLSAESPGPRSGWNWRGGTALSVDALGWEAGLSLVYPVLLTAFPAACLWYADRRRSGPLVCPRCNYDLRGLRAGAQCPECGAGPWHQ